MTKLRIEYHDIDELAPYENNPRFNEDAVKYVANSIKEFGWKVPVVIDRNMVIVAGHTRVKAAKQLGIREIPCIVADDLTEDQVKAFRLADNKTAEMAEWNFEALQMEMEDIEMDMTDFGFDDDPGEPIEVEEDDYEEPDELPPVVKLGEIWRCGDHVLLCGDSTNEAEVKRLIKEGGGTR